MTVKLGISTGSCWFMPLNRCLEEISNAGFRYVEISGNRPPFPETDKKIMQIRRKMDSLNLVPLTYHAPFFNELNCAAPFSKNRKYLDRVFAETESLEIQTIVIHPGDMEQPLYFARRKTTNIYRNMEYLAAQAEKKKVVIALENMLPHLIMGDFNHWQQLYRQFASPWFKICFDTSHANLTGNISDMMKKTVSNTVSIHLSDNKGSYDDHMVPGEGTIKWDAFFKTLCKLNYNGYIILELDLKYAKEYIQQEMKKAAQFCVHYVKDLNTQNASGKKQK